MPAKSTLRRRIVSYLNDHPFSSVREVARAIRRSSARVKGVLQKGFVAKDFVRFRGSLPIKGRKVFYYAND